MIIGMQSCKVFQYKYYREIMKEGCQGTGELKKKWVDVIIGDMMGCGVYGEIVMDRVMLRAKKEYLVCDKNKDEGRRKNHWCILV